MALAATREDALEKFNLTANYLRAFEEAEATQNFLNGLQNYPLLKGMQTNLYKCFLPQAWIKNIISVLHHFKLPRPLGKIL